MASAAESRYAYKNTILAALPKAEIARLAPHLSPLPMPAGKTLRGKVRIQDRKGLIRCTTIRERFSGGKAPQAEEYVKPDCWSRKCPA